MGNKVIITEFANTTQIDFHEHSLTEVHACGYAGGDPATLCGIPFVDEVKTMENTKKPVTCPQCMDTLNYQEKYIKRNGKWY